VPRAIFVDTEIDALNELSSWSYRPALRPDNILFSATSSAGNFAKGLNRQDTLRDQVMSAVASPANANGDGSPTFLLTHSLAGGAGGGLGAAIVQRLRTAHPNATIVCCSILSDAFQQGVTRPYNEVMALNAIRSSADLVVILDNKMLAAATQQKFGQVTTDFTHHNKLAARALGLMTCPLRLPTRSAIDLRELARTLTPFATLNLAGLAIEGWSTTNPTPDLVASLRTTYNRIGGHLASDGTLLSPVFIAPSKRSLSGATLRADKRLGLPTWFPPAPLVLNTRSRDPAVLLVESNTGIHKRLDGLLTDFDRLFKRKAHLQQYVANGVSNSYMANAFTRLRALSTAYQAAS
jgi:hypothetical protein